MNIVGNQRYFEDILKEDILKNVGNQTVIMKIVGYQRRSFERSYFEECW